MSQITFQGIHAEILADHTPERDVEGALGCGKTTVCLWAELEALDRYPGIWTLLTRYSDDAVSTKLRPAFDQLCAIRGLAPHWDDKKKFYQFENGSRAYAFGLKSVSLVERYEKIRGLPVSRIFLDQAESVPSDIASELRARLRPDIIAKMRGEVFPTQLTFSANPVNTDHWLAVQFPVNNSVRRRKYFCVSLADNAHNLPADTVDGMLQSFPPEHPKHITVILGQRGPNVIGVPIYEGMFERKLHVRAIETRDDTPILEAYELGKHNPCWMAAQRTYGGGLRFLGGILGRRMMIEDFLPVVSRTRLEWFPKHKPPKTIKSCTAPMGDKQNQSAARFTLLRTLRTDGVQAIWRDNGNAPDVQLGMIEYIGGLLRRRALDGEESIGVNSDVTRWVEANQDGLIEKPFLAFAFEGGYTWSDHFVSVSHKEIRQPREDDEFANAMRCVEHLALNFCVSRLSESESASAAKKARERADNASGMPSGQNAWMGWQWLFLLYCAGSLYA